MEYIIKKDLELPNGRNTIEFSFSVQFLENKLGFKNFDINNIIDKVEKVSNLSMKQLKSMKQRYPMYINLSIFFFENIEELDGIAYEYEDTKVLIERKDIIK